MIASLRKLPMIISPLVVIGCFCLPTVGQEGVQFHATLDQAVESNDESKPYVLYFGASWCQSCNRMKVITFELLGVDAAINNYQWVKFDIDDSPEVAAAFQVTAVPALVVLDADRQIVGTRAGFVSAENLLKFVAEVLVNPQTPPPSLEELESVLLESETEDLEAVALSILVEVANPERSDRQELLKLAAEHQDLLRASLFEMLDHQQLKIRAAAARTLSFCVGEKIAFDPFAKRIERETQIKVIKDQLKAERN